MKTIKSLPVILALTLATLSGAAQELKPEPFEANGKWGFKDSEGYVNVEPLYDEIRKYDYTILDGSYYGAKRDGKWCFVCLNTPGTAFVEHSAPVYDQIGEKAEDSGVAATRDGQRVYVDINGKELDAFYDSKSDKYGVKNVKGDVVILEPKYDRIMEFNIRGYALVEHKDKWGLIDAAGREVIPPRYGDYDMWDNYDNNDYAVLLKDDGKTIRTWVKVGYDGKEIGPPVKVVRSLENSLRNSPSSSVRQEDGGFYRFPEPSEGLKAYRNREGKVGFADTARVVIPAIYEDATRFVNGTAAVKQGGKWGVIDREGKTVVPFALDLDACEAVGAYSEGLIAAMRDGKWGYIDREGNAAIPTALAYDEVFPFSDGMARVKVNKKMDNVPHFGYIDRTGREVIRPSRCFGAGDFQNGLAPFSKHHVPLDKSARKGEVLNIVLKAAAAGLAQAAVMTQQRAQVAAWQQQARMLPYYQGAMANTTSGSVYQQQSNQAFMRQYEQRNVEIANMGFKALNYRALATSALSGANTSGGTAATGYHTQSGDRLHQTAIPNSPSLTAAYTLIDKTGKALFSAGDAGYSSIEWMHWADGKLYIVQTPSGDVIDGAPLFYYGIYDADRLAEAVSTSERYTRFDVITFAGRRWIMAAKGSPDEPRYGVIDYAGKVVVPCEHGILDAAMFYPAERILAGDILKKKDDGAAETASLGVIDYEGRVVIPKTECAAIIPDGDGYLMLFADGTQKRFDAQGKETAGGKL